MGEWINATEAAQRLGVKQATLYAYVSRGMLARRRGEDGRSSLFEAEEVARLAEPTIDFALATLTSVAGMIPGAGEAIFAVARTAGWIAHALEEYAKNAPLRPRTVYTGPHPISPEAPVVPGPRPVPQPSAAASRE